MLLLQPDAIAVVASLGLGGLSGLPLPFSVPLAYGAMVASQTRGLDIIGLLHNCTAQQTAAAPPDNVDADLPMDALCAGYEAHHWESTSNCLHACGMLWAFGVLALMLLRQKRWPMLALVPPCWYLFAWTGHFVYQADVPAVFTYGTTLRGWSLGEWCSVKAFAAGRTVSAREDLLLTFACAVATYLGHRASASLCTRSHEKPD